MFGCGDEDERVVGVCWCGVGLSWDEVDVLRGLEDTKVQSRDEGTKVLGMKLKVKWGFAVVGFYEIIAGFVFQDATGTCHQKRGGMKPREDS